MKVAFPESVLFALNLRFKYAVASRKTPLIPKTLLLLRDLPFGFNDEIFTTLDLESSDKTVQCFVSKVCCKQVYMSILVFKSGPRNCSLKT